MRRTLFVVSLMLVIAIPVSVYALATFDGVQTDPNHDDPSDLTSFMAVVNGGRSVAVHVPVNLVDGVTEKEAELIAEVTFSTVMGQNRSHRLDGLTLKEAQMTAHYSWGYEENDLGHIFDMTADLVTRQITVSHCF